MSNLLILLFISAIFFATNAQKINCKFSEYNTHGYGCKVENMDLNDITGVIGTHLKEHTNNDVLYFEATSKTLKFIPKGIFKQFPNVRRVKLNFEKLVEITGEDLKPFGDKLTFLSIPKSSIEVIPSNIFASTPNINYMYIAAPNLKSIENGAFEKLQKLNALFVRFPCEDDDAMSRDNVERLVMILSIRCHDKKYPFVDQPRPNVVANSSPQLYKPQQYKPRQQQPSRWY